MCYLNNHGKDFKGGIFHFQDGEPSAVVPFAGVSILSLATSLASLSKKIKIKDKNKGSEKKKRRKR